MVVAFARMRATISRPAFLRMRLRSGTTHHSLTHPSLLLRIHLDPAGGLEGIRKMTDFGFRAIRGPGNGQDVETGLTAEQMMSMQEEQSQIGQATLLSVVYRLRGPTAIFPFGRTDFDEDHAIAVERDQIQFTTRAREIATEDAIAETSLKKLGRCPL